MSFCLFECKSLVELKYLKYYFFTCRKKREESDSGKTGMTQDEIIASTRTVLHSLEALRSEHAQLIEQLGVTLKHSKSDDDSSKILQEKTSLASKCLEGIELGIGEAEVMMAITSHLQQVDADKQKLRAQVRRLCQENAWLR